VHIRYRKDGTGKNMWTQGSDGSDRHDEKCNIAITERIKLISQCEHLKQCNNTLSILSYAKLYYDWHVHVTHFTYEKGNLYTRPLTMAAPHPTRLESSPQPGKKPRRILV
jgi:hypothetical protein